MSRVVTFGEIMGRLATPGFQRFAQAMPGAVEITFAGAEATVAVSIAQLGGNAAFVTALPSHAIADACVANLRGLGVDTSHIVRTADGRLGLYFLEKGASQRPYNVLYDREGSAVAITPPGAYDWNAIFQGASWFHITGITPALSRNAAVVTRTAMAEAAKRGLPVSMDVNFRSKLWNWDPPRQPRELAAQTIRELLPHVNVFLGGLDDAGQMLDIRPPENSHDPVLEVARRICSAFPNITHVAMSLRESLSATHNLWGGALYDAALDRSFRAPIKHGEYEPFAITDIVDRLGAGDAFAAGLIYALGTPELAPPSTAISFAVAAGCLAHSIEGDFNYCSRDEIEALMGGSAPGRVRR
jgi:2-dehydro-3-deoxygluconokinase